MAKENRIGALWKPTTNNERAPLGNGHIEVGGQKIPIVVWVNRWKHEGEKTPDYYIERREEDGAPRAKAQSLPLGRTTQSREEARSDGFADDIPF